MQLLHEVESDIRRRIQIFWTIRAMNRTNLPDMLVIREKTQLTIRFTGAEALLEEGSSEETLIQAKNAKLRHTMRRPLWEGIGPFDDQFCLPSYGPVKRTHGYRMQC